MDNKKLIAIFREMMKDFAIEQEELAKSSEREAKRRKKYARTFQTLVPIIEEALNPKPIVFRRPRANRFVKVG